ncbi:MAG: PilW family protein [Desulfobacteraceae bacterium]
MSSYMSKSRRRIAGNRYGFTMLELLIAMGISAVVLTAVMIVFRHMLQSSTQQIATGILQQNQRGALDIMERELRLIGMDRNQSDNFQITDVRKYSIVDQNATNAVPDGNGSPVLRMQVDLNEDGVLNPNETITYSLYDRNGDGQPPWELSRSTSMAAGDNAIDQPQMIAEGVEAFGLAYAFDGDDNGKIDRDAAGAGEIIWAVDSNNDGALDTDISGNAILDRNGNAIVVLPEKIKGVQFWLLGRNQRVDPKYFNNRQYPVGGQLVGPFNDRFRRWLLSEIIHCRNL